MNFIVKPTACLSFASNSPHLPPTWEQKEAKHKKKAEQEEEQEHPILERRSTVLLLLVNGVDWRALVQN